MEPLLDRRQSGLNGLEVSTVAGVGVPAFQQCLLAASGDLMENRRDEFELLVVLEEAVNVHTVAAAALAKSCADARRRHRGASDSACKRRIA